MKQLILCAFVIVTLCVSEISRAQTVEYEFTNIVVDFRSRKEDLVGCAITGINDVGTMVGGCTDQNRNSAFRGFLYDGRKFKEIKIPRRLRDLNAAFAIETSTVLALPGKSLFQSFGSQVSGNDATIASLVLDRTPPSPTPQDINNQDEVTGWYFDGTRIQGFLWSRRRFRPKVEQLAFPNAALTEPTGLNDNGQVVGDYRGEDGLFHGFLYENGVFTTIDPPFVPGEDSAASGINNLGQIVGCYAPCLRGYFFDPDTSTFTSIDVPGAILTQARDINDLGQIVGVYSDGITSGGFLYDGGEFTLVHAPGAVDTTLFGINNDGAIVGAYVLENAPGEFEHFAFVATAVEP
jgi:probable HAF family extracellular repeat protein